MIRINRLLRTAKTIAKVPTRGGPGWDRPDVPPTQTVETDKRWTHHEIVYTFFDSSMPEFYITETEIYEGGFLDALPQFASIWGFLLGTALSLYLFHEMVNPTRTQQYFQPISANYFLNQYKKLNEEKVGIKYAKQNPFGITINNQQFPYQNRGEYFYPKGFFKLKASVEHLNLINSQAAQYLKGALQRASKTHHVQEKSHH